MEKLVEGPFCRIRYEKINLNSHDQIKKYLLGQGWKPTEWNVKKENGKNVQTSPKLTEDSFDSVEGELPKLITRRAVLVHRQRMLKNTRGDGKETGWLNLLRSDGRLEARAIVQGTNTGRAVHRIIVNVPSIDAIYGAELRSLFTVPDDSHLLGIDANALEARCLAHFLLKYKGGDKVADILLHGDIHEENAKLWGCTRKEAKSPLYALLFGAQPAKLASTMNVSLREATKRFEDFWKHYYSLAAFKDDLVKVWNTRGGKRGGFLKGLDGRKLFARSEHSLVNLMVQSTGSVLVKTALVFIDREITRQKIDATQIIFMHDEAQYEVKKYHTELLKDVAEKAFLSAGEYRNFSLPLVGEAKYGANWKETH